MPSLQPAYWSADDVRALPPDGNRYECIDGELLVTPSPTYAHQDVILQLIHALAAGAEARKPARLYLAPADVEPVPGSLVQPDLFVAVPKTGQARVRQPEDIERLLLVVEVLSPGTARVDRGRKRDFYQRIAVPEYWIVDADSRLVERWRPGDERPEVMLDIAEWRYSDTDAPVRIDLQALFVEALDD